LDSVPAKLHNATSGLGVIYSKTFVGGSIMSLDYVSNQEIIQAARRNLPQNVWDYLTGG